MTRAKEDLFEAAVKDRDIKRAVLEQTFAQLEQDIREDPPNVETLEEDYEILKAEAAHLETANEMVLSKMLDAKRPDEEYKAQYGEVTGDRRKITKINVRVQRIILKLRKEEVVDSASTFCDQRKNHHRWPKLEMPKFNGDNRTWLQFWSQFQTIDNDELIPTAVKFQYLLQCMVSGSRAMEVVNSYPVSDVNYPLVLADLKDRFGREDVLVEVYIRDLLGLVLENAASKKSSSLTTFSSLYVRLSAQLRALGTLGVTTDKCAAMLYPLVESTLPDDVLIAWERYRVQTGKARASSEENLDLLLKFLKEEVAGKERIQMARDGFSCGAHNAKESKRHEKGDQKQSSIPTAAGLLTSDDHTRKSPVCIFCEKAHQSEMCGRADSITRGKTENNQR